MLRRSYLANAFDISFTIYLNDNSAQGVIPDRRRVVTSESTIARVIGRVSLG